MLCYSFINKDMAARKIRLELTESWKKKIQVSNIMTRLEKCALGTVEMSPEQIRAAQIVLGKVVPDLARQENTGKDGGPQEHVIKWGGGAG